MVINSNEGESNTKYSYTFTDRYNKVYYISITDRQVLYNSINTNKILKKRFAVSIMNGLNKYSYYRFNTIKKATDYINTVVKELELNKMNDIK